ncbi:hypothetical protein FACS1894172_02020 [Spirochaetia bacterium]|nr:hypothetical protein FACS1894172_02020 [Spirochaetia bacterium]
MRATIVTVLLSVIIGTAGALDVESPQFINHLLSIHKPGKPELYEDAVIFTAPSSYRRVGVAFAHENFSTVHWLQKMVSPEMNPVLQKQGIMYNDIGLMVFVWKIPETVQELEYRLVIDGLWTVDPANPVQRFDRDSGLMLSVLPVAVERKASAAFEDPVNALKFTFQAERGATINVAGTFNNWDPFMYQLIETSPGMYSLTLPLPPGTYQYVFICRGERTLDPNNQTRVYDKNGRAVSQATVR